ncbi:MAG: NUDIX hydrolase [Clostridia bacterium]|nr:NUDIX hydrolase [Clostridia bacterium]
MELFEKEISRKYVFEGKIFKVRCDKVTLPDGKKADREIIEHSGGSGVLAVTEDDEILLVKQYRRPYDEITYEIPAGKLNPGENPKEAALRELSEETGYSAETLIDFGKIYPSPGYLSEIVYIFFAKNVKKTGDAHTDEDEYLSLVKMPVDEAQRLIEEGRHFYDAKTIIAITKYLLMKDKLN